MEHISEAIHQAQAHLRDHPDEARYTDSSATAVIVDGLHCTVTGPDGATVDTDMPASVGGSALAASPGWLLRAAAASCVATVIAMRAATSGRDVTDLVWRAADVADYRLTGRHRESVQCAIVPC